MNFTSSAYYQAWLQMLRRHPDAYLQALLNNVYGSFYLGNQTALSYTDFDNREVADYPELVVEKTPLLERVQPIAQILLEEGYIKNFQLIDNGTQGVIRVTLKYGAGKEKVISGLRRVSKPGLRVYAGADELPKVLRGLGIAIVSTSKGVMTDKKAREAHVGGEVLAFVW